MTGIQWAAGAARGGDVHRTAEGPQQVVATSQRYGPIGRPLCHTEASLAGGGSR
jgi:hypothetical protein